MGGNFEDVAGDGKGSAGRDGAGSPKLRGGDEFGIVRPGRRADRPFILKSWLKSAYPWRDRRARGSVFWDHEPLRVNHILNSADVAVDVWCDAEVDDMIFGFVVHDPGCVHCVYIKKEWRNLGAASWLCDTGALAYSYNAPAMRRVMPEATFNPYLANKP